jgi:hypothetical protein
MRRTRHSLAAMIALMVLGGVGGVSMAQAQEAPCAPGDPCDEVLFEVTLPPGAMGDRLERINSGGLIVDPGVEAVMGTDDASVARAGEPVQLAPADLIFLPVLAVEDLVPGATIAIANPGSEPAVTRGFHAHAYESFSGWPDGISETEGFAEANDAGDLAAAVAGDLTYRLVRMTVPAGSPVPLDDPARFTLLDVHEGKVQPTVSGGGDEASPFWNPIHGGYLPHVEGRRYDLLVSGEDPASIYAMTVLPRS